ncbi:MAG: LysM peptidoglycan-binding domain-containing protein [Actinomycetota bacterium]
MSAVTIHDPVPVLPVRRGGQGAVVIPFPSSRVRSARPERPGLRITRRGRLALTTLATAAVALAGLLGASAATAGHEAGPVPTTEVVVLPGDTLWGIASQTAAPGEDVRDVIADIVTLNGLESAGVTAGQRLVVPAAD